MSNAGSITRARSSDLTLTLYQELRARGDSGYDQVVAEMGLSPDERERCRAELMALGLITSARAKRTDRPAAKNGAPSVTGTEHVAVIDPETALLRLLQREQRRLQSHLAEADRSYSTLKSLAERFLRADSLARSEMEVELLTDRDRIRQVLQDISNTVQHEIAAMCPSTLDRESPERALDRDRRHLAKGVRLRTIYHQRFTSLPGQAAFFDHRAELGVEIRLSPVIPMHMVIVDHHRAVIPLDPARPDRGAIHTREPALVRSYLALYEYCWHTSTPYGEVSHPEKGGDGLSEQQHAALRMLACGMKDEKIARNLGVSLRTVSRMLSEIMQALGASSRFEAGVRATRLGWLD
ncbi:helix-turn-helix transcriptional regulator [Streptomyces sp. NPDC003077]|uniref:helix-turn-helix transcriptional regulator n=1 Tax=Streptomyces sp. NPDC003077 TaxID=3154443 RepID=UPI0033A03C87